MTVYSILLDKTFGFDKYNSIQSDAITKNNEMQKNRLGYKYIIPIG